MSKESEIKNLLYDTVVRLTSRKFVLAVGTVVIFVLKKQYPEAAAAAVAYITAEGVADVVTRTREEPSEEVGE